jgi:hypothetical protein
VVVDHSQADPGNHGPQSHFYAPLHIFYNYRITNEIYRVMHKINMTLPPMARTRRAMQEEQDTEHSDADGSDHESEPEDNEQFQYQNENGEYVNEDGSTPGRPRSESLDSSSEFPGSMKKMRIASPEHVSRPFDIDQSDVPGFMRRVMASLLLLEKGQRQEKICVPFKDMILMGKHEAPTRGQIRSTTRKSLIGQQVTWVRQMTVENEDGDEEIRETKYTFKIPLLESHVTTPSGNDGELPSPSCPTVVY